MRERMPTLSPPQNHSAPANSASAVAKNQPAKSKPPTTGSIPKRKHGRRSSRSTPRMRKVASRTSLSPILEEAESRGKVYGFDVPGPEEDPGGINGMTSSLNAQGLAMRKDVTALEEVMVNATTGENLSPRKSNEVKSPRKSNEVKSPRKSDEVKSPRKSNEVKQASFEPLTLKFTKTQISPPNTNAPGRIPVPSAVRIGGSQPTLQPGLNMEHPSSKPSIPQTTSSGAEQSGDRSKVGAKDSNLSRRTVVPEKSAEMKEPNGKAKDAMNTKNREYSLYSKAVPPSNRPNTTLRNPVGAGTSTNQYQSRIRPSPGEGASNLEAKSSTKSSSHATGLLESSASGLNEKSTPKVSINAPNGIKPSSRYGMRGFLQWDSKPAWSSTTASTSKSQPKPAWSLSTASTSKSQPNTMLPRLKARSTLR